MREGILRSLEEREREHFYSLPSKFQDELLAEFGDGYVIDIASLCASRRTLVVHTEALALIPHTPTR